MKILLCEDDINIATIAKLVLEKMGQHEVVHVTDGESALAKGVSEKFDLILLDDMMPKMSGVDVCAEFHKHRNNTGPVIFMSANQQDRRVEQFAPIAIGFIPKPFDPMTLNEQINNLMKGAAGSMNARKIV